MQIEGNTHHMIYSIQNCDGLPPVYILDRALEFVQREYNYKVWDVVISLKIITILSMKKNRGIYKSRK